MFRKLVIDILDGEMRFNTYHLTNEQYRADRSIIKKSGTEWLVISERPGWMVAQSGPAMYPEGHLCILVYCLVE